MAGTPNLLSRIVVTWAELLVVGGLGGIAGAATSGPPQLVAYFAVSLLSVGVVFHNVNELVKGWLAHAGVDVDDSSGDGP